MTLAMKYVRDRGDMCHGNVSEIILDLADILIKDDLVWCGVVWPRKHRRQILIG